MDVRVRDGVAAAGDATVLRPRLNAPANALALPPPSPAKLGIRQLGTTARLGAKPGERRFIVDGADRLDIAIVHLSHHVLPDVHAVWLIRARVTVDCFLDEEKAGHPSDARPDVIA